MNVLNCIYFECSTNPVNMDEDAQGWVDLHSRQGLFSANYSGERLNY